ncbi:YopX family protein [Streptococcus suis]|uniref:YopX family protein n=1 Tax=Streptococcus suis TaxID=1307 RepID=UPI001C98DAAB|nr:YopX family protein [Streptococcus suis]MBY4959038.1 YopX family protein [Streptococcus suis]
MVVPKFRVWDTVKKAMSEVQAIVYTEERVYPIYSKAVRRYIPFSEAILMQPTGLFDTYCQNELFEDDIILWTYFDEWEDSGNARIVYRDGCWKLLDVKTDKEVWDTLFDCLENCSVYLAGNIYENPELVEGING